MALKNNNEYTEKIIKAIAKKLDISMSKYHMDEVIKGMSVELEHGSVNLETDVTNDDPAATFKIVLAHLDEIADYYTRLDKMEEEAKKAKKSTPKSEVNESISNRYKELCGVKENKSKKQLTNEFFKVSTKPVITEFAISLSSKEELKQILEEGEFKKIEFENDGIGDDGQNEDLYAMQDKDGENKMLALEFDVGNSARFQRRHKKELLKKKSNLTNKLIDLKGDTFGDEAKKIQDEINSIDKELKSIDDPLKF